MKQFDLYLGQDIPAGGTVSHENILDFIRYDTYLESFTLIEVQGAWHGLTEDVTILRIIEPASFLPAAQEIARNYKLAFSQEAVLLVVADVESELI